jgi:hypothetical protein
MRVCLEGESVHAEFIGDGDHAVEQLTRLDAVADRIAVEERASTTSAAPSGLSNTLLRAARLEQPERT